MKTAGSHKLNDLYCLKFFSFWIFTWFVLYQINVIKFNPIIAYYFVAFYLILKFIFLLRTTEFKEIKRKNKISNSNSYISTIIISLLVVAILDIIPLFIIKNKKPDCKSFIFFIALLLLYLSYMKKVYNYNCSQIFEIYNLTLRDTLKIPPQVFITHFFNYTE